MGMLGMGNGSVFQLLPQRFPNSVGILTGIVGAAGGLGGFLLPSILGLLKDRTGSFGTGFAVLTILALTGVTALVQLREQWRRTWPREAALRAGMRPEPEEVAESAEVYAANI
jgi:NNP family nitrate/nitrite transporter-like MFS transporter